jgi:lipid II:glycine glycyltransferase (peptidoglycan interpeptide bridge formation enzyme)
MVKKTIEVCPESDWSELYGSFRDQSLLQTAGYANAKAALGPWRVERSLFTKDEDVVGCVQALVRSLPVIGGGLVWINRGPLWRPVEGKPKASFAELVDVLRHHYVDSQGFYVRIAPPVEVEYLPDEQYRKSGGTAAAGMPGWASAALDLSVSLETLRAGLKGKWRGHLNKAERSGLEIKAGAGSEFETFLEAHTKFTETHNFETSVTTEFLAAFQSCLPDHLKLYAFLAYSSGYLVGSILIAKYGATCEYLAGNSTDQGRRLNVGQLLVWRAISTMHDQGFKRFDVSGMDPEITPKGIYDFKEGLGGTPYRLAPELELGGDSLRGRLVRWRVNRARSGS